MNQEKVVLVNDNNEVVGEALKSEVHTAHTPLHRAFSIFLFNDKKEVLLQQRSKKKKTWPLVWSNSCCGHPSLEETPEKAAIRRLQDELGISLNLEEIHNLLPNYRYRAEKDGVVENEICPVLVGMYNGEVQINPGEVESYKWIKWEGFLEDLRNGADFSPWCKEESFLLEDSPKFHEIIK